MTNIYHFFLKIVYIFNFKFFILNLEGGDLMKFLKSFGKLLLLVIGIYLIFRGGLFIYLKSTPTLEIGDANNILLYDSNKKLFFQGNESKQWVSLKNISQYVKDATIYTEDKHFYQHNGFDYLRIAKARKNHSRSFYYYSTIC